jgi:hypothetical protein
MRPLRFWPLAVLAIGLNVAAFAGTPGSFRGVLRESADAKPGWMYVQSRNDMLRLVRVSGASVVYSEEIPESQRLVHPRDSLRPGAEVRVVAEPDNHGNWRAQEIEILRLAPAPQAQK